MERVDVAVIGAGSVGIAVAYYLVRENGVRDVALIDSRDPMSLTSAQSGENYRNWWPHPVMTAFTDHSISLMEDLDSASGGRLHMRRGGYALATRRERPEDLIADLYRGYAGSQGKIRIRESASGYHAPRSRPWQEAPDGVDVLLDRELIGRTFPAYAPDVATVIHIRRAGSIDAQQMGSFMLEAIREAGGRVVRDAVTEISRDAAPFTLHLARSGALRAGRIVNAAGPFIGDIAAMLGESLPVKCVFQQKIAFADIERAVPRDMPFTIDLDGQTLAWSEEDRAVLASDASTRHLVQPMKGGIHCRPDGPVDGNWIKLGWAYNEAASDPHREDPIDTQFPDTVVRAASRLNPSLAAYIGRLPRGTRHYGGYYTMTEENWPLIGAMKTPGAFVAGALSGYGSMAACATGAIAAAWIAGREIPAYARDFGLERQGNASLLAELATLSKGTL
ncbi:MAG TPA: FAD-binding oxidoreductase [Usitatibacter sp.]|nr:FAD-binding oxidoreductase [Usitatibacter sp.]